MSDHGQQPRGAGAPGFNPFQGLVPIVGTNATDCQASSERFQSLSGFSSDCRVNSVASEARVESAFQSLSGFSSDCRGSASARQSERLSCFNPFQGLVPIVGQIGGRLRAQDIMFQSLSGFSSDCRKPKPKGKLEAPSGFNPFQGLVPIVGPIRIPASKPFNGFNPFQGLVPIVGRAKSDRISAGQLFQSLSGFSSDCRTVLLPGLRFPSLVSIPFRV